MAVVLTILKIIGIILLCILGLLLLLLLMVLFIPVRYRVNGAYTAENMYATAKVRWFIFRVIANYNKGDPMSVKAKVAWFTVYSMGVKKKEDEQHIEIELPPLEENSSGDTAAGKKPEESGPETVPKPEAAEKPADKPAEQPAATTGSAGEKPPKKPEAEEKKKKGKKKKEKKPKEPKPLEGKVEDSAEEKPPEEGPFDKLEAFRAKVETKRSHIEQFLARDATKRTIERGKKLLKKIFKHLKPTKGRIDLHMGLGSAADTGMILGKAAKFYPLYGKWLFITPNFYEKVIEAEGDIKGRIRIGTIAIPGLIFYLRKDTRRTIKLAKKI